MSVFSVFAKKKKITHLVGSKNGYLIAYMFIDYNSDDKEIFLLIIF